MQKVVKCYIDTHTHTLSKSYMHDIIAWISIEE